MWKEIEGYEGHYEVSDSGLVRSIDRYVEDTRGKYAGNKRFLHGAEMKQTKCSGRNHDGYMVVNLHKNSKSEVVPVHILVAKAFVPNKDSMPTVNHIDGNKYNNCANNLEWVSYSENNIHALANGLRQPRNMPIGMYSKNGELLNVFQSASDAARQTGISRGMISHCLNGRASTAYGFKWEKLSESQTTIPNGSTREDELPVEAQRPLI